MQEQQLLTLFEIDLSREVSCKKDDGKENKNVKIFKLLEASKEDFLNKIPKNIRECLISKKNLEEKLKKLEAECNLEEIINEYIPDEPSTMSGDFGEILSFFLIKDYYSDQKKDLIGFIKWRHKIDKNKPLNYTDLVFFHMKGSEPSKKDFIIFGEVKTNSTNKKSNTLQDALNDNNKDYLTRNSKTLIWMRELAIRKSNKKALNYLNRFIKAVENVEYEKKFKSISVIDKDFLEYEISNEIDISKIEVNSELILISVEELQNIYREAYIKIKELEL